jgi:O-antigen/teichoic acid export membrane protein
MEKLKNLLFNNLSPKQTVLKNTFWLYFSEIVSKGFRLLVFIYIIRVLDPKEFGIFEYLLSFVGIFFFLLILVSILFLFVTINNKKIRKNKRTSFLL